MKKSAEEIRGFEYDWLGRDAVGRVALFSSAGGGAVPAAVLRDTDAHDAAIEALLSTDARTRALFAPVIGNTLRNTWRLAAERGLYAFDSDPNGGPYHLVAAPELPARLDELPSAVREVAGEVVLRTRQFADVVVISAEWIAQMSAPPGQGASNE